VARINAQAASLGVLDRIEIHAGLFTETFARLAVRDLAFAMVHVDANIYESTLAACRFAIPRVSRGGAVVFDDYHGVFDLGARLAIDTYRRSDARSLRPLAGSSAYMVIP
jgi:hypothetical protein